MKHAQNLGTRRPQVYNVGSKGRQASQRTAPECRQWMKAVLQPLNEKAKDIIVKHADLLQSSHMEPLLLQLVAHVSAYQVILQR